MIMEEQGLFKEESPRADVFIAAADERARAAAAAAAFSLRANGVIAEFDVMGRSVKAQMKFANKIGARFAAVLGESELAGGRVKIKDMNTGVEREILLESLMRGEFA
jgi:histidyl-tRNA synthetase